jgi:hypothetical protein
MDVDIIKRVGRVLSAPVRPSPRSTSDKRGHLMAAHDSTPSKACRKCGEVKPLGQFITHLGHTGSCKRCYSLSRRKRSANSMRPYRPQHGLSKTRSHRSWREMIDRCTRPTRSDYRHYGGRGIKVCERWSSLDNFFEDMGERPDGMSLDRIDVNGDYCPDNCRWASRREQCLNTRRNVLMTFNGETRCVSEWSEIYGIRYGTVYARIKRGLTPEEVLRAGRSPRRKKQP